MGFQALNEYMHTLCSEKNIPGAGVRVYRYGELLFECCTGFMNVEEKRPFTADTLVNLYSCTKITTVTAAMRLVEKGLLSLDAPVSEYLPEFTNMLVYRDSAEPTPAQNTMRIRHLFSMSAGVNLSKNSASLAELRKKQLQPNLTQIVRVIAQEPLLFEPGTRFKYGLCHDVLGAVMERVTGKTLGEVLRDEVISPIGMQDTGFRINDAQRTRMAPEYHGFCGKTGVSQDIRLREGVDMGFGSNYESGGGGLISCLKDYGKLACALGNGGLAENGYQLLRPSSINLLCQNQMTERGMIDFNDMGGWSKAGYGYALGVRTLLWPERNNSLSAEGEFGWDGALGCYLAADPKNGVGIMYFQQEAGSKWYEFHGHIRNLAYVGILG